jgi:myosin heavy subunit
MLRTYTHSTLLVIAFIFSTAFQTQAQSRKEQIEALTQTTDSLKVILANERAKCISEKSELDNQIKERNSDYQKSEETNQNLTKTLAHREETNQNLTKTLAQQEENIQALQTDIASQQAKTEQLQELLKQAQEAIDASKKEVLTLEENATLLTKQNGLRSDSISDLTKTITTVKSQISTSQNSIDKLNGALKQKTDSINALSTDLRKLALSQSSPTADFSGGKTKDNFNSLKQKLTEIIGKENKNALKLVYARLDGIYGAYASSLADGYEFAMESNEPINENTIDLKLTSPNSSWLQLVFVEHYTDPMGREESTTSSLLINKSTGYSRTWDNAIIDGKANQLLSMFNKQLNIKKPAIKSCGISGEEVFNMSFDETDIRNIVYNNGNLELTYFVMPESYGPCNQTITVPWIDVKVFFNL